MNPYVDRFSVAVFRFAGEVDTEALENSLVNSGEDNGGMHLTAAEL